MSNSRFISAAVLIGSMLAGGHALAGTSPVTFASVTDTSSSNDLVWTDNGNGTATLNTAQAGGDAVDFSFVNLAGLPSYLQGQLSAVETINGGAGVSTSAAATQIGGYDVQTINGSMVIAYTLATPVDVNGQMLSNLLTITLTPSSASGGPSLFGQDGGSATTLSTTNTASRPTYTEKFTSDFISFTQSASLAASFALSAVDPAFTIGNDGVLSSFTADLVATFSANPPPSVIPEPASAALLVVGLTISAVAARRRRA